MERDFTFDIEIFGGIPVTGICTVEDGSISYIELADRSIVHAGHGGRAAASSPAEAQALYPLIHAELWRVHRDEIEESALRPRRDRFGVYDYMP